MTQNKYFKKHLALTLLSVLCAFGMGQAAADSSLQAVVQSYSASGSLQKGMIIMLTGKSSDQAEPSTLSTVQKMSGVIVAPTDAPVTLSPAEGSRQQVYVATSGRYEVLVSNQNGVISPGDYITVSSLAGVGMKADSKQSQILGKAAVAYDGVHATESTASVHDETGKQLKVNISRIPVDIGIAPNPLALKLNNVPGFLQRASVIVANKPVSAVRIYAGLLIVLGTMIVSGSLLYGGVKSGMVAVGRNPLARSSIMRNLLQVILTSVIIFVTGLFAVYLLLKL